MGRTCRDDVWESAEAAMDPTSIYLLWASPYPSFDDATQAVFMNNLWPREVSGAGTSLARRPFLRTLEATSFQLVLRLAALLQEI